MPPRTRASKKSGGASTTTKKTGKVSAASKPSGVSKEKGPGKKGSKTKYVWARASPPASWKDHSIPAIPDSLDGPELDGLMGEFFEFWTVDAMRAERKKRKEEKNREKEKEKQQEKDGDKNGATEEDNQQKKKNTEKDVEAEDGDEVMDGNDDDWEDEEEEEDEEDEEGDDDEVPEMRIMKKPKSCYINDGALISERGLEKLYHLYEAIDKRIPEHNGFIHIFNDYAGYGCREMLQYQVAKYEQELYYHVRDKSDPKPLVAAVFPIVEALSFMFGAPSFDESTWLQIDDGEDVENLCRIMGCMFLHFVRELDAHNPKLLDPEKTPIKNLGLVLGNMCCLADLWTGMVGYDGEVVGWKKEIMKIAEKHGVNLKQITKTVVDYDEKDEDDGNDMDEEDEEDEDDKWDFFSQWKAYKKSQEPKKMGVPTMDLSNMTEAERRELGTVDSEIDSGSDEDYEFYVKVT